VVVPQLPPPPPSIPLRFSWILDAFSYVEPSTVPNCAHEFLTASSGDVSNVLGSHMINRHFLVCCSKTTRTLKTLKTAHRTSPWMFLKNSTAIANRPIRLIGGLLSLLAFLNCCCAGTNPEPASLHTTATTPLSRTSRRSLRLLVDQTHRLSFCEATHESNRHFGTRLARGVCCLFQSCLIDQCSLDFFYFSVG